MDFVAKMTALLIILLATILCASEAKPIDPPDPLTTSDSHQTQETNTGGTNTMTQTNTEYTDDFTEEAKPQNNPDQFEIDHSHLQNQNNHPVTNVLTKPVTPVLMKAYNLTLNVNQTECLCKCRCPNDPGVPNSANGAKENFIMSLAVMGGMVLFIIVVAAIMIICQWFFKCIKNCCCHSNVPNTAPNQLVPQFHLTDTTP